MADDRPVDDPVDQVGQVQRDLDDLKATMLARVIRRPTGDIEPTIRTIAKDNTLLLDGTAVSRTTYPDLWAWVQEQALVVAGLFTAGDGTTTFGLPDFRGRTVRGRGAAEAVGLLSGSDSLTLLLANLPSHTHTFTASAAGNHLHTYTTDSAGNHGHSFSTDSGGAHGGHNSGSFGVASGSGGAVSSNGNTSGGSHSHTGGTTNVAAHTHAGDTNTVADHTHSGTTAATGTGTAIDNRPASISINWAIWT